MIWRGGWFRVWVVFMIDFTHPCLTLPLISVIGVFTSLAGIAVIEGIMKRDDSDEKVHFLATLWGLLVLIALVVLACGAVFFGAMDYWEGAEKAGQAGDMFGGLTALFSGLAFAGLITALFTQRQELITQRKELGLQRKELELSRREYKLQRFENTLFAMIELFNGHVQSLEELSHSSPGAKETGKAVLSQYASELVYQFEFSHRNRKEDHRWFEHNLQGQLEEYVERYELSQEYSLGPYFRLLYRIINHIEKAELEFDEAGQLDAAVNEMTKQTYAKTVRAFLGPAEIKLLMFNCATEVGEDFRPWVIKYQLLKNIHLYDAQTNPNLVRVYGRSAFGDRYEFLEKEMAIFEADTRDSISQGEAE